jgi:hypothetical protein
MAKKKKKYNVRIAGYRPFYETDYAMLAVRLTRQLLDAGYSKATLVKNGYLVPIWEEDFENEVQRDFHFGTD